MESSVRLGQLTRADKIYKASAIDTLFNSKQDVIGDLDNIRSGASAGATAVQPNMLSKVATSGSYNDLLDKPTLGDLASKDEISSSDLNSELQKQFKDIKAKDDAVTRLLNQFGITSSTDVEELDVSTLASIVKELCLALVAQSSN